MSKKEEIKKQIQKLKDDAEVLEKQLEELEKEPLIIDRIKSFGDACRYLKKESGKRENQFLKEYKQACDSHCSTDLIAYLQLRIITAALNEEPGGWSPNYSEEDRWHVWYRLDLSDSSLSAECPFRESVATVSYSGSRLCYKTKELAEYSSKQFKDIWKNFLVS